MIKITFIIPYNELNQTVYDFLSESRDERVIFSTTHYIGYEGIKDLKFDADVIIARGITCSALKEYHKDKTIIELTVSGYDVINAVAECKKKYNPKRIAIIGSENMVYGAPNLQDTMDVEIQCYIVEKDSHVKDRINEAVKNGAEAIVSGLMTYEHAISMGINAVWIKTGKEAIKAAIDEAVRTAIVKQEEKEKAELFKTIMNYTHEAIIAVDRKGYITVFNKAARKIVKPLYHDIEGRHIKDILKDSRLPAIMDKDSNEVGLLESINDTLVTSNGVPIKVKEDIVGAVATFQNVSKIQELEKQIRQKIHDKGLVAKYNFSDIMGSSRAIMNTIDKAFKFSQVDSNIMLLGETGVGKELFAQSIHNCSKRKNGPFVAINCAALPENLLESELFGYADGAFTGANKGGKVGLFELAHNGTIFLDEIGEVSLNLQSKLLRVLQEKEIMRIGHDRIIPVNVRIISATNKNLRELVNEGRFRNDILYRLDVLKVNIPPLRERKEDIITIFRHYLNINNNKYGKNIHTITSDAEIELLRYGWPGNVRELVNVCERTAVLAESDTIDMQLLLSVLDDGGNDYSAAVNNTLKEEVIVSNINDAERQAILKALETCGGNKTTAAQVLGISRATLWRKLKNYQAI